MHFILMSASSLDIVFVLKADVSQNVFYSGTLWYIKVVSNQFVNYKNAHM